MLNQIIANQLLEDIVDAYRFRDIEILKRKLEKAMEKIDAGKPGKKAGKQEKILCKQCNRMLPPYSKDLCRTCGYKGRTGRPKS